MKELEPDVKVTEIDKEKVSEHGNEKREIRCSGFYFPLQVSLYCYYLILMNQFA